MSAIAAAAALPAKPSVAGWLHGAACHRVSRLGEPGFGAGMMRFAAARIRRWWLALPIA
jgi:hypothetical protein